MRNRLTSKTLFAENRKDGIFPGDIGNEERSEKYYDVDEFNNEASEFKPGWDLPEKHDIKDERDEMNFGVKKDIKAEKAFQHLPPRHPDGSGVPRTEGDGRPAQMAGLPVLQNGPGQHQCIHEALEGH